MLQNYVNAELDKTEMLMNLKKTTLSMEIEYYQEIYGGARGVMVIVVGNGLGGTSSNPGRD